MSSDLVSIGAPAITNMDDLLRVSKLFADSRMFRDSQDAAQAGVKILAGLESGFGAFAAMSGVHVIEGKASIGANLMALAIKRSGKYNYRVLEHTETSCVVEIYERWDGAWQSVGKSSFTIEDAKAAGVRFKDSRNNPTPWAKFPRNMLFSRAVSNAVRWYCPDCMNVTVYAAEELGAEVDGEGNVIQAEIIEPEKPAKPPEPVAWTDTKPPTGKPENTQAEQAPKPIGAKAGASVRAYLSELGFDERGIEMLVMFTVTERDVPTLADLTKAEADLVMAEAEKKAEEKKNNRPAAEKDDGPPFDPDPEPKNFAPDGPSSRLLSNTEASNLHKALAAFGIKEHYEFASEVKGRRVNSLQACTVGVSAKIYEAAVYKRGSPEQIAEFNARKAAA